MKGLMKMAAISTLAAAGAAQAGGDNINVGDVIRFRDGPGNSTGGEFHVARAGNESNANLFTTFCLQRTEHMDFHVAGFNVIGVSTQTRASLPLTNLAPQVAYLYTQFRAGTLANATAFAGDGVYGGTDHEADANALQNTIWSFMGQTFTDSAAVQALRTQANNSGWTGVGNVRILNLTWATNRGHGGAGTDAQDMLTLIPLPTGAALGLAGMGLLAIRRRGVR
jgi:hypothetical protein